METITYKNFQNIVEKSSWGLRKHFIYLKDVDKLIRSIDGIENRYFIPIIEMVCLWDTEFQFSIYGTICRLNVDNLDNDIKEFIDKITLCTEKDDPVFPLKVSMVKPIIEICECFEGKRMVNPFTYNFEWVPYNEINSKIKWNAGCKYAIQNYELTKERLKIGHRL